MRGRRPSGPEYVDKLEGSPEARQRLTAILETLAGDCRLQEACTQLGIAPTRFHQIRSAALQAALEQLEPGPVGRPPRSAPENADRIQQLEARVHELEIELRAAQTRAEIALALPRHADATPAAEKKTTRRSQRRRRSGPKEGR